MEHRWGTRHLLDLSVRLDGAPQILAFARLRDASSSGAYVETDATLALGARVWVELAWKAGRCDDRQRICAYVVRRDAGGAGLEWYEFAPRPILALIETTRRTQISDRREERVARKIIAPPPAAASPLRSSTRPHWHGQTKPGDTCHFSVSGLR